MKNIKFLRPVSLKTVHRNNVLCQEPGICLAWFCQKCFTLHILKTIGHPANMASMALIFGLIYGPLLNINNFSTPYPGISVLKIPYTINSPPPPKKKKSPQIPFTMYTPFSRVTIISNRVSASGMVSGFGHASAFSWSTIVVLAFGLPGFPLHISQKNSFHRE